MMTIAEARAAWDYALALDDAGVKDPSVRRAAVDAWHVAADAAEEVGQIVDAGAARQMAISEESLLAPNMPWLRLGKAWRDPWTSPQVSNARSGK